MLSWFKAFSFLVSKDEKEVETKASVCSFCVKRNFCGDNLKERGLCCTREKGHEGEHVACSPIQHSMASWGEVVCECAPIDDWQKTWCMAHEPETGWVCSKPLGHSGQHTACNEDTHNLVTWGDCVCEQLLGSSTCCSPINGFVCSREKGHSGLHVACGERHSLNRR